MFNIVRLLRFIFPLVLVFFLVGCNNQENKNSFDINGKLSNSNNEWIIVYKLSPKNIIKLDSAQLDDAGKFDIHIQTEDSPELLLLKVKDYPERVTLLAENKTIITISGDALHLNKTYSATGNKGTIALRTLTKNLNGFMTAADSIYFSYRRLVNDSNGIYMKAETDSLLNDNYTKAYNYVRNFCLENKNSLVGIVALYSRYGESQILDYDIDFNVFEKVSKAVSASYPDNDHALNLKDFVDEKYRLIAHGEEVEKSLEAGNKAPDIIRPNPEGKQIELSSFQGQYLVLAFWSAAKKSSWEMNAGLKKIVKEYKNKKVDILSVSMDKDKLQWVNTIALDHLKWNHVLSSESVENAYNLKGESRLFLIDTEGVILAKDITTDSLKVLLNQLIK